MQNPTKRKKIEKVKKIERKINPMTGCYCTFAQHMVGDGCDRCNPEYASDKRNPLLIESLVGFEDRAFWVTTVLVRGEGRKMTRTSIFEDLGGEPPEYGELLWEKEDRYEPLFIAHFEACRNVFVHGEPDNWPELAE